MRLVKQDFFFTLLWLKISSSETQTHCRVKILVSFRHTDILKLYTFTPRGTTPFRAAPCQSLGFGLQTLRAADAFSTGSVMLQRHY